MVAVADRAHQPDVQTHTVGRGLLSSSRMVTRTPPTRSLIKLNTMAIKTLNATPATIKTMPITDVRRKISSPSSCQTW